VRDPIATIKSKASRLSKISDPASELYLEVEFIVIIGIPPFGKLRVGTLEKG
jgi:hypothetical protein